MQTIGKREGRAKAHHNQKGGQNNLRRNIGKMIESKDTGKVARAGAVWQWNKNQRIKRYKEEMAEGWDKEM